MILCCTFHILQGGIVGVMIQNLKTRKFPSQLFSGKQRFLIVCEVHVEFATLY